MLTRRIILTTGLILALGSVLLPYKVTMYEGPMYYTPGQFQPSVSVEKVYSSGIDEIAPLLCLPVFVLLFILLGFVRTRAGNIISIIFGMLNLLYMPIILFAIHFQLFVIHEIHTGIGFYVIAVAAMTYATMSIIFVVRPMNRNPSKKVGSDSLLDDI